MTLGSSKHILKSGTEGNTWEFKFRGTCDHITLMTVVSVAAQILKPLVVLQGVEAK